MSYIGENSNMLREKYGDCQGLIDEIGGPEDVLERFQVK
jgi:hypothetical protein